MFNEHCDEQLSKYQWDILGLIYKLLYLVYYLKMNINERFDKTINSLMNIQCSKLVIDMKPSKQAHM